MNIADSARTLADSRSDTLHRGQADISGSEHTGSARLQQERCPAQGPSPTIAIERDDVGSGQDEPALVARDGVVEPIGVRLSADEGIEPVRLDLILVARVEVDERQRFEMIGAA